MSLWNMFGKDQLQKYLLEVKESPDDPEAHFRLGAVYEQKGKVPEAIEQFQETLRLAPRSAEAHFNLGILYEKAGEGDSAIVHMNKAGTLFSERGDAENKERARKRLRVYYEKYGFKPTEGSEPT